MSAFIGLSALTLTGCGAAPPHHATPGGNTESNGAMADDSSTTLTIDPLLPPGGDVRPPNPGESGRVRNEQGLPILEPKGPNLQQLFAQDIQDPVQRIKRLENTVLEMRRDLDAVIPAINRLLAIEGDIHELTGQLQTLLNEEGKGGAEILPSTAEGGIAPLAPLTPPPPPAHNPTDVAIERLKSEAPQTIEPLNPDMLADQGSVAAEAPPISLTAPRKPALVEPNPAAESPEKAKPDTEKLAPSSTAVAPPGTKPKPPVAIVENQDQTIRLSAIRLGKHQDKIRLVIDTPHKIDFTADLDNQEHLLVIELPGVAVETARQSVALNPLIKNMALNGGADEKSGGRAVFELTKETKLLMSSLVPPAKDKKDWRLTIDLSL